MDNTFPIKTQIGVFHNETDIDKWILSQRSGIIMPIDYISFINHPYIYNDTVSDSLSRFNAQKNYGIVSHSYLYDEVPAKWIDTLAVCEEHLFLAQQDKAKHGKK